MTVCHKLTSAQLISPCTFLSPNKFSITFFKSKKNVAFSDFPSFNSAIKFTKWTESSDKTK